VLIAENKATDADDDGRWLGCVVTRNREMTEERDEKKK
jgi:hypothetical protein